VFCGFLGVQGSKRVIFNFTGPYKYKK